MKIAFRTDASVDIGSGHLMRCLTLARQLASRGAEIAFICRDLPGSMFEAIDAGFKCIKLQSKSEAETNQLKDADESIRALNAVFPEGVEWLVVDHYQLDFTWEVALRSYAKRILVIDDLANRQHLCDALLDQNYYIGYQSRYKAFVDNDCELFLGPSHVLFRPEFYDAAIQHRIRDGEVKRVLVFFGASDVTNQTQKVVDCIPLLDKADISFDVVVGASNPNKSTIEASCEKLPNVAFHCQVNNMAELMLEADLAVGAGGATTWERCILGLPCITVVFAENQLQTTLDLAGAGVIHYLGSVDQLTKSSYLEAMQHAINAPDYLLEMSEKAKQLMTNHENNNQKMLLQTMLTLSEA